MKLPNPAETPTVSVGEAAEHLGMCRQSAYRAARRGEIPTIKIGRSVRVPTAELLRMLGVDQTSRDIEQATQPPVDPNDEGVKLIADALNNVAHAIRVASYASHPEAYDEVGYLKY